MVVVIVLAEGRMGRLEEIVEKREELYVRDGERSHDVGRICGLVWIVSGPIREDMLTID